MTTPVAPAGRPPGGGGCVVVALLGERAHGKSTLANALLARQALRGPVEPEPDLSCAERHRTGPPGWKRYATPRGPVVLVDCSGSAFWLSAVPAVAAAADGVVLVVAADRCVQHGTRAALLLARQAGVRDVVPFLTRTDLTGPAEADRLVGYGRVEAVEG
jgi:elongation factor Tu